MSGMPANIYTCVLLVAQPGGGIRAMARPVSSRREAPGFTSSMTLKPLIIDARPPPRLAAMRIFMVF